MKRLASLLLFCLPLFSFSQSLWTNHLSYRHADHIEAAGNIIYGVFSGNLLSYDSATGEVRLFSKDDGLGGKGITAISYAAAGKKIILLYDDGLIDILDAETNDIFHIYSLKNNTETVGKPHALNINGDYAAIATTNGVALLQISKEELRGFYSLGGNVTATAYADGKLFASVSGKVLAGKLSDNLYDLSQWQTAYNGNATLLCPTKESLYVQTADKGLVLMDASTYATAATVSSAQYDGVHQYGTRTVFFRTNEAIMLNADKPTAISRTLSYTATPQDILPLADTRVYMSLADDGIQDWRIGNDGTLTPDGTPIAGYGAQTDRTGHMYFIGDRLITSGGSFDYYERTFYAPNAGYLEDGEWTFLQTQGVAEAIGTAYRSVTSMVQDPKDPGHHFVATGDYGLLEFRDTKFSRHYTLDNSPLQAFWNNAKDYVRVDALSYDAQGNLWMANLQTDTLLRVLRPDGTWRSVFIDDLKGTRHIHKILFDADGRLWATSRSWIGNRRAGILCLEYGSLDTPADDKYTFRFSSTNEDGAAVDFSQGVYSMVQDLTGRIWVGTYSGLYVIDDPVAFSRNDFRITQVKVPRNDGTNYADYLLAGVPCTALAVDGADRKWIGVEGSGLYVVSADGTEILQQFTTANSPLPSDNILALAIHPRTGEVFIGTDAGLVSYQSHVTEAAQTLSKDNLNIYPNPVRPDQGQSLTVSGLTAGADIKVMTAAGQAVAAGTSTGGTFRWDCRDTSGRLVPAGVYYLLIATEDASAHIAGKVAVVR